MTGHIHQGWTINEAIDGSSPFDVLAVVVSVSVDIGQQRAHVLIADPSIPVNTCARITLRHSTATSLVDVSVGDVLRFHGLIRTSKFKSAANRAILCDFAHSWKYPVAGPLWTRLGCRNGQIISPPQIETTTMSSPPGTIRQLIDWFSKSQYNGSIPNSPCQRRQLCEIQSAGIVSHVIVRILSFDTASNPSKWKKTAFATVTDSEDAVMTVVDCERFESTLKSAMENGQRVLWTDLASTRLIKQATSADFVLTPTRASRMTIIHSFSSTKSGSSWESSAFTSLPQALREISSRRFIASPIKDIIIGDLGVSLRDGKYFASPNHLISLLVNKRGRPQYRQATLMLEGKHPESDNLVGADASIIQTICGGLDAEIIVEDPRFQYYVTNLVRGLLEEKTNMNWTIDHCFVSKVSRVTRVFIDAL